MGFMREEATIGFIALFLLSIFGLASFARADWDENVPYMTLKIYNNSPDHNIYPVLTTGTSATDLWLQTWFHSTAAYPRPHNFRFYVDPTGDGIPPRGFVVIRLPLLTQLVANVNPSIPDQYIDWWAGGRVEIFAAKADTGRPPVALTQLYRFKQGQTVVKPFLSAQVPVCSRGCDRPLKLFKDTKGVFGNNEPSQLIEYTLGAITAGKLNTENVDIDVSYVDTAFLPAAITPFNRKLPDIAQVGYVGTPQPISTFEAALRRFTAKWAGWPQFINSQKKKILKLPSTLHIFAGDPDMTPPPWRPIGALIRQWNNCVQGKDTSRYCANVLAVRKMFLNNYKNYVVVFKNNPKKCTGTPIKLTEHLMRAHVYGFSPFVEGCNDPKINLLENTPGYRAQNSKKFHQIKNLFDRLQYQKFGKFSPYTVLIHGKDYVNAPNVYAYSVDDAVGNLQAEGTGFIIVVGGTRGLPNPNPATPPINVNLGFSKNDAIRFVKYGICTRRPDKEVNPDFPSFGLSVRPENFGKCPISLVDNRGNFYTFSLIQKYYPFPFGPKKVTPATHAPINCNGNRDGSLGKEWCDKIYAYREQPVGRGPDASFVITGAPKQPAQEFDARMASGSP